MHRTMAAPRCARSLLGPAKRVKVSVPKPHIQTYSRRKSSQASNEDGGAEVESGELERRLKDFGLDELEFKQFINSQKKAAREDARSEPKTREEAQRRWEELKKTPDHHTLLHLYKRAGVEPIKLAKERGIEIPGGEKPGLDPAIQKELDALRSPINVRALNLRPLRRAAPYGIPVCDLQLRTYSIRNLQLFADFAMRAAYYMGLPARGPTPLPRITERWTVPRANFVFKKSQENFERVTMRRLIQIQDGHPDVVKAWLAFLQRHQFHGVGMKANIWECEGLDAATNVGVEVREGDYAGRRERPMLDKVQEILGGEAYRDAMKDYKSPAELRP